MRTPDYRTAHLKTLRARAVAVRTMRTGKNSLTSGGRHTVDSVTTAVRESGDDAEATLIPCIRELRRKTVASRITLDAVRRITRLEPLKFTVDGVTVPAAATAAPSATV
jgi:hypothetical protein